jgi:hypothetical protein
VHSHIFTTGLARRALLGATVASALAATPALAAEGPQGVRAGHNVTVFHNIDMVAAFGSPVGAQTQIDVFRGAHHVATARGAAVDTPEGGALETNHGPAGAAQPGDCWTGATPDVKPGDRIVVSNPGSAAGLDEAIVDNITIDTVTGLDTNPATGNPVELRTVPVADIDPVTPGDQPGTRQAFFEIGTDIEVADPRREIWVEGEAWFVDENGDQTPIPLASLDSGEFLGPTDNQLRMSPTTVIAGTGGAGTYMAKYIEGQLNIERNRNNIPVATILQQLEEDSHGMGYGHTAVLPPVSMLVEGMAEQTTAAPGCEAAPKIPAAIGTSSVNALNIANTGPSATDPVLALGGWAPEGAGSAEVVLSNGGTSVTRSAALSGGTGQQGWTAEFTKDDVAGLAQGTLSAQLNVDGAPAGPVKTVAFDTVAPAFTVNLAEGTYTGTQRLIVSGDPVTYRVNGGPTRTYAGVPIELGVGSHSVALTATDAAGNTTTRTLNYVVRAVPAPPAPPAQQRQVTPPPAPVVLGPAPVQVLASTSRAPALVSARMLRGQKRVKRASARRRGLVARFSAPAGARRATLRVYRTVDGDLQLVGTKSVSVRRGTNRVRLSGRVMRSRLRAGLYVIKVTLRNSAGRGGTAASSFVRVIR